MPADKTRNTLARQWQLLRSLPTVGSGKTARDLMLELQEEGFKVGKRQVERDLKELSETFEIECNDRGMPYGWLWKRGASTDLSGLTVAEALSLRLVEDTVRPLLPASMLHALEGRFRLAEKKLTALAEENKAAQWAKKVSIVPSSQPLLPPPIAPEVLEAVQEALMNNEQIDADYQSMQSDKPSPTRLHPLGMVNRGPVSYLVATAWKYDEVLLYAMHRISRAERTYEACRRPKNFNLDEYIDSGALQFGSGKEIRLKAQVSEDLGRILSESPLSEDQVLKGGKLTATVRDTWQLHWWILSQSDSIKVESPAVLRNAIVKDMQRALKLYAP